MTVIFTRYLYDESSVSRSLVSSLLKQNEDEALFWAFELYWSGFHKKTFTLMFQTIKLKYTDYYNLYETMYKLYVSKGNCPELVSLFVSNICAIPEISDVEFKNNRLYITNIDNDKIEKYQTSKSIPMNFHFLPKVCYYQVLSNIDEKQNKKIIDAFRNNWLAHAAYSPIWKDRILKFGGTINKRNKTVEFPNDDLFDNFYDEFCVEPEEQPKSIYRTCLGVSL